MSHTVLIVDDSKLARLSVRKAISATRPDWSSVEAADAAQALACLQRSGADLALLDFNMPGMNGLEFAAELRRRRPTMPIALITANVQDTIISQAREIGVGFIPKPISEESIGAFLSGAVLQLRRHAQ